jgi:Ca2+-binding EF-hand superfamily protein
MKRIIAVAAASLIVAGFAAPVIAQGGDFDLMGFADTNKDGKVSLEEFTAFQEQGWGFLSQGAESIKVAEMQPMMKPMMAGVPVDGSGAITHKAYMDSVPARFKAADKNGDGFLSKEELLAMFPAPPAA